MLYKEMSDRKKPPVKNSFVQLFSHKIKFKYSVFGGITPSYIRGNGPELEPNCRAHYVSKSSTNFSSLSILMAS